MIHWIYLIPALCIGWALATLCTCCETQKKPKQIEEGETMLKAAFKRIIKHIENRRKWNRTKRWMQEHAYTSSRLSVGLISSGALRLWK